MPISVKIKVCVTGPGNDITWKKLPTDEIPDYMFNNNLEEKILDLVGTVQSDKTSGTTRHIGLIKAVAEFALVPGVMNPPFTQSAHPGAADYNNPSACTTM